jgi:hypothetical protein
MAPQCGCAALAASCCCVESRRGRRCPKNEEAGSRGCRTRTHRAWPHPWMTPEVVVSEGMAGGAGASDVWGRVEAGRTTGRDRNSSLPSPGPAGAITAFQHTDQSIRTARTAADPRSAVHSHTMISAAAGLAGARPLVARPPGSAISRSSRNTGGDRRRGLVVRAAETYRRDFSSAPRLIQVPCPAGRGRGAACMAGLAWHHGNHQQRLHAWPH